MPFPKDKGILAPSSLAESPSFPFSKKLFSGLEEESLFFLRFGGLFGYLQSPRPAIEMGSSRATC